MTIRQRLMKFHPINLFLIRKRRNSLKNTNFSLLSSNCMGGFIMHLLGLRFLSPFVNIRVDSNEFVRFVLDYKYYLSRELNFITSSEPYPVAKLDDITLYFVHYSSKEEAEIKWNERKKTIKS